MAKTPSYRIGDKSGVAPAAGYIGENLNTAYVSNINLSASNTWSLVASIVLNKGEYLIGAIAGVARNGATYTAGNTIVCTLNTSAAFNTSAFAQMPIDPFAAVNSYVSLNIPSQLFIIAADNTTLNLYASATYSAGTPQALGKILCTRIA